MSSDGAFNAPLKNPTKPWWAIATFFGVGFIKPGPGTWGSIAAVLLWGAFAWLAHPSPRVLFIALLIGIFLTLLFGIPAASVVERESGGHDPQCVVIDEVAGQWITLLLCPADWRHGLIALALPDFFGNDWVPKPM